MGRDTELMMYNKDKGEIRNEENILLEIPKKSKIFVFENVIASLDKQIIQVYEYNRGYITRQLIFDFSKNPILKRKKFTKILLQKNEKSFFLINQ